MANALSDNPATTARVTQDKRIFLLVLLEEIVPCWGSDIGIENLDTWGTSL
jgi:hypothetical protein